MLENRLKISLLFLLLALFGTGCVTHQNAAVPQASNQLKVKEAVKPEEKIGVASWYGPKFYGRKTASGERFKKHLFTCAHRTLPFGTKLEVRNLSNDKTVEVTVNDRGPFAYARIIDLSYAAAKEIGLLKTGTAKVAIRQIKPIENETAEILSQMEKKRSPEASELSLR